MNKNHKTLELDLILEKLAAECSCDDAKDLARGLKPAGDMAEVEMLLQQTEDAFSLLARFGGPSFSGLKNVNNSLHRAAAGGSLNPKELLILLIASGDFVLLMNGTAIQAGLKQALISFLKA